MSWYLKPILWLGVIVYVGAQFLISGVDFAVRMVDHDHKYKEW